MARRTILTQYDIREELSNYMSEVDIHNVPIWIKEALRAWMEAVELGQDNFFYYDDQKARITKGTDFLSLDQLLDESVKFVKFRSWFNDQIAKFNR